jgi:hypothetical protein
LNDCTVSKWAVYLYYDYGMFQSDYLLCVHTSSFLSFPEI